MFLAPWLLGGLLLAAAPIVIHLLNRRRFKRLPWAAMEFLSRAVALRARRLRIEELLLLALRTLAVVLLALALARPVISRGGVRDAIILIDTSASMRYAEGAGTLFDFALSKAREIASALDGGTVVAGAFDARVKWLSGGAPMVTLSALDAALSDLSPSWGPTDYGQALREAARVSEAFASGPPAVFIISDFRKGAEAAEISDLPKGPVFLIPVARDSGSNAGITDVRAAGAAFTASADAIEVVFANASDERATLAATVTLDEGLSVGASATASAASTTAALVEARGLAAAGRHLVEARLTEDAYGGDDRFFAVIERRPLEISTWLSADAAPYVTSALGAAGEGAFAVEEHRAGTPSGVDGFVLAGDFPASEEEAAAVWERVRRGGFAVVFAGGRGAARAAAFLAASGEPVLAAVEGGTVPGSFTPVAAGGHPVTRFLGEQAEASLAAVTVRDPADFPVGDGREGVETPIVLETPSGRRAFLLLARTGAGAVAVFNDGAERTSGDFVISPLFLPLVYESISYVSHAGAAARGGVCGRPLVTGAESAGKPVVVRGPSGDVAARLVSMGEGFAWSFTPEEPGFFYVNDEPVAVNIPASEAEVRAAERAPLERALRARMLQSDDLSSAVGEALGGREISAALLAAAVVVLAVEMLVVFLAKRSA